MEYNFAKNSDIEISKLSISSRDPVWWKCSNPNCAFEWKAAPASRIKGVRGNYTIRKCPACIGIVRNKPYAKEYPDLAHRFLTEKNQCTIMDPDFNDITTNYWWHCEQCGMDF